jgi:hypothetical protein
MARIKILGKMLTDEEVEALKALGAEAGCEAGDIEVVESVGEPDPDCEDEIIFVLATPRTCADPDLEQELAKIPNGGRRTICIWPKGSQPFELPPATTKYSYSIVPWSVEKLRVVVADDDITCFESPTGQPLPKARTERNLCVEQVGKPK